MTPKSLTILAIATAVSVSAAGWQISQSAAERGPSTLNVLAFPELKQAGEGLREVHVATNDMSLTLRRTDAGWGAVEKGMYPVAPEKVRAVLLDAAALKLVEPKTDNPDRYERLFLRDPSIDGAKSKSVSFRDANGTELAGMVVGKKKFAMLSGGKDGTYLRRTGEARSWLALGTVALGEGVEDWVEKSIVDIEPARVKRVTLTVGSAEPLVIYRDNADENAMKLAGLSEGETIADQLALDDAKEALSRLELNDVASAAEQPIPGGATKAIVETFDGLILSLDVAKIGPRTWMTIMAEGGAEAESINARTAGWAYNIPPWKARFFEVNRDKLVKAGE